MTWVRRLLHFLKWAFLAVTGVLVVRYLVLLLSNREDQPPSERVLAWRKHFATRPPVADADNGYVYMLGFAVHKVAIHWRKAGSSWR
ncbi:MAG: hypothetical protein K0R03_493 [Moraxellaceae bacterium]|jgi:hypothetical protein|nr:hypothetical protein [Moraxellaceae bacterium]